MMQRVMTICVFVCIVLLSVYSGFKVPGTRAENSERLTQKEKLGKLLFHDRNLSSPPGQACVDCHDPGCGFGNPDATLPVSRGVYRDRFGSRNDLTAAYAAFIPEFHFDEAESLFVGGLFWDGRAATLEEQAKGPPLNGLANTVQWYQPDAANFVSTWYLLEATGVSYCRA